MTTQKNFHVAVIGGGIAGMTLAIALHRRQIPVTIYEQAPAFGEVGAGVSFGPNAVEAMKVCHRGIHEAFERVCTRNLWPSKQKVWFDYLDGFHRGTSTSAQNSSRQDIAFTISNSLGQTGVHRAHFLDELIQLVPSEIARFNKRLENVTERADGKLVMHFADGSEDLTDVVVGCDGIKSQVRRLIVGDDHPSVHPSYTHKYAYRGLVPMEQAIEAVGEELASNSCMHMGPGGHMLTFPVNQGKTLNIVAFHTSPDEWTDYPRLTRQGTRDEALRDFAGYGPNVTKLLKLTDEKLSVWAIFDLGDHPVPTFHKGRICITGDAAHATSPHHGAGAGFCIEDTAVLATLLADERVQTGADLAAVLAAYDHSRRERAQWLVQSSRFAGNCYEWLAEGVGADFAKIEQAITHRNGIIAHVDVPAMCAQAREGLRRRLGRVRRGVL
ncbi:FAD-dependent oxidoreductase [Aspergillus clavatus NRRL 1]|uniref:Salicylate hydroxylase, putative n=1 Tax=Aspergillus clavatus (strain ATCC 1007 / CBS 513.65 / DSM 816 / NCTC 3887 / NRRL 1 / QM 1276 / 107) TaxID=344612 RepID=A1CEE6_ASPCL|nr:salicylate hydroxylase, putative [Aspergillus clavatus NRRL 1]EAW11245.1 salicylate hydroxylase, putative [Aspergillus clavatus NRRL 1]